MKLLMIEYGLYILADFILCYCVHKDVGSIALTAVCLFVLLRLQLDDLAEAFSDLHEKFMQRTKGEKDCG